MSGNAYEYDDIAQNVFFPIYPVIASQILSRAGARQGLCLDAGAGGGHLGLALAEQSRLKVVLLDRQQEAVTSRDAVFGTGDLRNGLPLYAATCTCCRSPIIRSS